MKSHKGPKIVLAVFVVFSLCMLSIICGSLGTAAYIANYSEAPNLNKMKLQVGYGVTALERNNYDIALQNLMVAKYIYDDVDEKDELDQKVVKEMYWGLAKANYLAGRYAAMGESESNFAEAKGYVTALLEMDPDNDVYLGLAGDIELFSYDDNPWNNGPLLTAFDYYQKAIKIQEERTTPENTLGLLHIQLGHVHEKLADYAALRSTDPGVRLTEYSLAEAEYSEASQYYAVDEEANKNRSRIQKLIEYVR